MNSKDKNEAQTGRKELAYPVGAAHNYQLTGFLLTSSGPRQEQSWGERLVGPLLDIVSTTKSLLNMITDRQDWAFQVCCPGPLSL